MFGSTLLLALREIRRHILRSILTTLGIIIGVAAVVTMVTLGNGVTASVQEEISSLGASNFIIFPVRTDRGTIRPFDYVGCMVNSWSLGWDASGDGSMVDFQVELFGREEQTNQTLVSPTWPTVNRFTSVHASLTIAGSAYCVDSGSITGNNNLEVRHQACAADGALPKIRESGHRDYGGTLVADFGDLTAYNRFVNGTEAALVVTISASADASLVATMNVRFDGDTPNVTGPDVLKQSLPFVCTSATSDAAAITMVLTNSDSAA
jgi:hypothetical protein